MTGKRLLLLKPSSLGDIIHTLPLVHALKRHWPGCSITWVVERAFQDLLKADPAVDSVFAIHIPSTSAPGAAKIVYAEATKALVHTFRALRAHCQAAPYDLTLDLQASFRSGLLALANPGGKRLGFAQARELNTFFQHELIHVPAGFEHAVDINNLFAAHLGCRVQDEDFFLATNDQAVQQADMFIKAVGLEKSRLIYLQPAARWLTKEWLPERWAELADRLTGSGLAPIFGGAAGDMPLLQKISAQMRRPAHLAAGKLDLLASAALMKRAALYLGVDTGPMHMAALAGVPVVALFGPTHPERVGPYHTTSKILQAEGLPCLRCRKRVCPRPDCMAGITVAMAERAVYELLVERG